MSCLSLGGDFGGDGGGGGGVGSLGRSGSGSGSFGGSGGGASSTALIRSLIKSYLNVLFEYVKYAFEQRFRLEKTNNVYKTLLTVVFTKSQSTTVRLLRSTSAAMRPSLTESK